MITFETQRFKEKSAKFSCEYLNNNGDGNERYRWVLKIQQSLKLKRNEDSKLPHGLKKGFTWAFTSMVLTSIVNKMVSLWILPSLKNSSSTCTKQNKQRNVAAKLHT